MLDVNDKKKCIKYIPIIKGEINRTLILMDDFLDYADDNTDSSSQDNGLSMSAFNNIKFSSLFFKPFLMHINNHIISNFSKSIT